MVGRRGLVEGMDKRAGSLDDGDGECDELKKKGRRFTWQESSIYTCDDAFLPVLNLVRPPFRMISADQSDTLLESRTSVNG